MQSVLEWPKPELGLTDGPKIGIAVLEGHTDILPL